MKRRGQPILFVIRDCDGRAVAIHKRTDTEVGKRMSWWLPDGTPGLGGLKTAELPLFGTEQISHWDLSRPVILTEGEKAALALLHRGIRALGTVTGAGGCPARAAFRPLKHHQIVLWPDNDVGGTHHMLAIARQLRLREPPIRWLNWEDAPPKGDAADAIELGVDPLALVERAIEPPRSLLADEDRKGVMRREQRRPGGPRAAISVFNDNVSVTEALRREFGIDTRPGRTVRCPFHDDKTPSLRVLPDNRRAYCHSTRCSMNVRGADAWDLANWPPDQR